MTMRKSTVSCDEDPENGAPLLQGTVAGERKQDATSDDAEHDDDVDNDGDMETGAGMGAVIAKILSTDVGEGDPVLAKRKTKFMREIEAEEGGDAKRKRKADKLAMAAKLGQQTKTDEADIDKERNYKNIATRAVVALFNAIAKHQFGRDSVDDASSEHTTVNSTTSKSSRMTQQAKTYGDKVAAAKQVQLTTQMALNSSKSSKSDSERRETEVRRRASPETFTNSWARDDYLMDANLEDDWAEDDADNTNDHHNKMKTRKDGADHAFLYSDGRKKPRV